MCVCVCVYQDAVLDNERAGRESLEALVGMELSAARDRLPVHPPSLSALRSPANTPTASSSVSSRQRVTFTLPYYELHEPSAMEAFTLAVGLPQYGPILIQEDVTLGLLAAISGTELQVRPLCLARTLSRLAASMESVSEAPQDGLMCLMCKSDLGAVYHACRSPRRKQAPHPLRVMMMKEEAVTLKPARPGSGCTSAE